MHHREEEKSDWGLHSSAVSPDIDWMNEDIIIQRLKPLLALRMSCVPGGLKNCVRHAEEMCKTFLRFDRFERLVCFLS